MSSYYNVALPEYQKLAHTGTGWPEPSQSWASSASGKRSHRHRPLNHKKKGGYREAGLGCGQDPKLQVRTFTTGDE